MDIEIMKAKALAADYQAGRMHEIVDELRVFLNSERVSMPREQRAKIESLLVLADDVDRSFAAVREAHAQAVERAEKTLCKAA